MTRPATSVAASASRERCRSPPRRVGAEGDELRDQRVVAGADRVALPDAGVDPDRGREPQPLDPPGLRQEGSRILGVEAHLDRMARRRRPRRDRLADGDPDLVGDEVAAGHELGDRVLDLDPGVQLEEEELAARDEELGRAGAPVADRPREAPPRRRRAAAGAARRCPARATPRAASGGGAGSSTRARRGRGRCRGRRRAAAPRRAGRARGSARRKPSRRRRPPPPRAGPPRAPARAPTASERRACRGRRRRPRP